MTPRETIEEIQRLVSLPDKVASIERENEILRLCGDVFEAFEDHKPYRRDGWSYPDDDTFEDMLTGLRAFALLAIGRGDGSVKNEDTIRRNVLHYAEVLKSYFALP